jgi:hypothetical protein
MMCVILFFNKNHHIQKNASRHQEITYYETQWLITNRYVYVTFSKAIFQRFLVTQMAFSNDILHPKVCMHLFSHLTCPVPVIPFSLITTVQVLPT